MRSQDCVGLKEWKAGSYEVEVLMFKLIDDLAQQGKYEGAFRECVDYHRFQGWEFLRRSEKTDLLRAVKVLEMICQRESIEYDTRKIICHLSVLAKNGHVSEALLNMTIEKVLEELA